MQHTNSNQLLHFDWSNNPTSNHQHQLNNNNNNNNSNTNNKNHSIHNKTTTNTTTNNRESPQPLQPQEQHQQHFIPNTKSLPPLSLPHLNSLPSYSSSSLLSPRSTLHSPLSFPSSQTSQSNQINKLHSNSLFDHHPLSPIGSQFNQKKLSNSLNVTSATTTTPNSSSSSPQPPQLFNHSFGLIGGSAQLSQSQPIFNQPITPSTNQISSDSIRNRDPHSNGSLTSSSNSSTLPDFELFHNPSAQSSAQSNPSSIGSPHHMVSSSPPQLIRTSSNHPQSQLSNSLDHHFNPSASSDDSSSPPPRSPTSPNSPSSTLHHINQLQSNHNGQNPPKQHTNNDSHILHQQLNANNNMVSSQNNKINASNNLNISDSNTLPRSTTTLWMGDLESWMDEDYVRACVVGMGWHLPHHANPHPLNLKIKMVSGASPSSAYCFLTYPTSQLAQEAWKMISNMPPTLMPGCERTFKLNWATGLPGVQPTWDREFSVFIRDLDREVSEGELVSLFTQTFPSTKSAKIMGDLSTGLSRGYAFIRFGEESDMHRALALGRLKTGTGMYLRGRSIKITEASGSSGTAGDQHPHHHRVSLPAQSPQPHTKLTSDRPRQSSLGLANSTISSRPSSDLKSDSQPPHRNSLPVNSNSEQRVNPLINREADLPHNLPQSNPNLGFSRANLVNANPTSAHNIQGSGIARPGLQTVSSFRPTQTGPPYHLLPYQRASVCIPPTSGSPLYPNGPSRTNVTPVIAGRPPSSNLIPVSNPPHHPQAFYSTLSHMRNSIAAPGYVPESFLSAQPAPAPYQLHPGVVSMGNFYTAPAPAGATPPSIAATQPAGYFPQGSAAHFAALAQIAVAANHANNDPSNTTVFVGGLPACISEETLKTFFQNFGEITYVKIPPNKGCGFVQYVRRADAEAAMLKMHDFPIHGKSRIRLSWGRSLGDKQVEYVRKLSSVLGLPFEAVWKIVEGQDHSTIKQIASSLGHTTHQPPAQTPTLVPAFHSSPGLIGVNPPGYGDHLLDLAIRQQASRPDSGGYISQVAPQPQPTDRNARFASFDSLNSSRYASREVHDQVRHGLNTGDSFTTVIPPEESRRVRSASDHQLSSLLDLNVARGSEFFPRSSVPSSDQTLRLQQHQQQRLYRSQDPRSELDHQRAEQEQYSLNARPLQDSPPHMLSSRPKSFGLSGSDELLTRIPSNGPRDIDYQTHNEILTGDGHNSRPNPFRPSSKDEENWLRRLYLNEKREIGIENEEDEWNQLEAEFRTRMKVEENNGWNDLFETHAPTISNDLQHRHQHQQQQPQQQKTLSLLR